MNRALAVLTVGAFLTLVLGAVVSGIFVPAVPLGAVFTVLGTAGFAWVRRRDRLGWSVAYVSPSSSRWPSRSSRTTRVSGPRSCSWRW